MKNEKTKDAQEKPESNNTMPSPGDQPGPNNDATTLASRVVAETKKLDEYIEAVVIGFCNIVLTNLQLVRAILIIKLLEPDVYVEQIVARLRQKHKGKYVVPGPKALYKYSAPFLEWLRRSRAELRHHPKLLLSFLRREPHWLLDVTDEELEKIAHDCGNLENLEKKYGPRPSKPAITPSQVPTKQKWTHDARAGARSKIPDAGDGTETPLAPPIPIPQIVDVQQLIAQLREVQQTLRALIAANKSIDAAEEDWQKCAKLFRERYAMAA
ncbi:MAG: hypothetical protein ABSC18_09010 [Verrucomicrobiota bacterium]|jgi:hypothetical protein